MEDIAKLPLPYTEMTYQSIDHFGHSGRAFHIRRCPIVSSSGKCALPAAGSLRFMRRAPALRISVSIVAKGKQIAD